MTELDEPTVAAPSDAPAKDMPLSEDYGLNPQFVRLVTDALDSDDIEAAKKSVSDLHPADLADLFGLLPEEERRKLAIFLGDDLSPEVLPELEDDVRDSVIEALTVPQLAAAIRQLESDDAVFVIEKLGKDKIDEILRAVPAQDRLAVETALEYEEDWAGRIMQREIVATPSYWTVGQIIDHMRAAGSKLPDRFYEVFIVDPAYRPLGAASLAQILRSPRSTVVADIMTPTPDPIPIDLDQEEVAYRFDQYNLISAPVVDKSGRLAGMITVDDVVEVVQEETHEDMLALAGVGDEGLSDSVVTTVRRRFSWLFVNLLTAIMASIVIAMFDRAIEQIVALAVLMPIIASMGGNAGMQTLTVAVRALAMKDLTPANAARIFIRETLVGGLNGLLFAIILGVASAIWAASTDFATSVSPMKLGAVVAAAMVINLLCAGAAGILVPLGLQRAGADPAVASSVFVTTVTDVLGFFVFLGLAALALV